MAMVCMLKGEGFGADPVGHSQYLDIGIFCPDDNFVMVLK